MLFECSQIYLQNNTNITYFLYSKYSCFIFFFYLKSAHILGNKTTQKMFTKYIH